MCEFDKKVQLSLLCPMCATRSVIVKLSQPIHVLQKLLPPDAPHKFYFNGQALAETQSFGFYAVKDEDAIIAIVRSEQESHPKNEVWENFSKKNDDIKEIISWATSSNTSKEFFRLRDINMNLIERKPQLFRKVCRAKMDYNEISSKNNSILLRSATKYEKPKEISSKPLPSFW